MKKGWRTIFWNIAGAAGAAGLQAAGAVDWSQYVSPTTAIALSAALNIGLRVITTTPVGQAE